MNIFELLLGLKIFSFDLRKLLRLGSFLEEPAKEGETPRMKGSVVLAEAESREEVIRILKEDIYSKNEVWDWSKVRL